MDAKFSMHAPPGAKDPVEYVEIAMEGGSKDVVHRPATDEDRQKYSGAYTAFKAGAAKSGPTAVPTAASAEESKAEGKPDTSEKRHEVKQYGKKHE